MIDHYGRHINYLRLSLTDRCNLRCIYCMPEEGITQTTHSEILSYNEILRICRLMANQGITRVKLTGGEPLVRKGCPELVRCIRQIAGIEQVTLTTNGILLAEQMDQLAEAGIGGINISLDTLDPKRFAGISRRDLLPEVLKGLEAALRYPKIPLKINCVPLMEEDDNYIRLAELAKRQPIHVRFIEMMPIGYGKQFSFRSEAYIHALLEAAYGKLTPVTENPGNGPCRYFQAEGFQGRIGFISAMTHKFCSTCNRVRLTAEGYLKLCLQYEAGTDLKKLLRGGCGDEEITEAIQEAIRKKPLSHHFCEETAPGSKDEHKMMSQIGG